MVVEVTPGRLLTSKPAVPAFGRGDICYVLMLPGRYRSFVSLVPLNHSNLFWHVCYTAKVHSLIIKYLYTLSIYSQALNVLAHALHASVIYLKPLIIIYYT